MLMNRFTKAKVIRFGKAKPIYLEKKQIKEDKRSKDEIKKTD